MLKATRSRDRTPEQLREHYEVECELAARLKSGSREERRPLYSACYDELFRRVPHHPQLTRKVSPALTRNAVTRQLAFLLPFLKQNMTFLEIGPGDCALSFEVCQHVETVIAIDVSGEIADNKHPPSNFRLVLSDGTSIPVEPGSIDVAYSNQLMEHLHPDDALEQVQNIFRSLKSGGTYICITPNRLSGPHDISKYFDHTARGFHLKEYSIVELTQLFSRVGFSIIDLYVGGKGRYVRIPLRPMITLESLLDRLPHPLRQWLLRALPLNHLLGIRLVVVK
jgi:SAM-dependent methyltransferase